jgi:UDP-GlcNAc:undecaprenyl-phosphate GlcNAc-1-phosphate transferase
MPLFYVSLLSFIFLLVILFFYYKKISIIFNLYDEPDFSRKIHKTKVPLLGGFIIFFYIFIYFFLIILFLDLSLILKSFNILSIKNFIVFFFTVFLIFFLGFVDDKLKIKNSNRILLLSFVLIPLLLNDKYLLLNNINLNILNFNLTITFDNLAFYVTLIFITILMVTLNIFDGINLQSGIFYVINFIFLSYIFKDVGIIYLIILPLIIFLYLNYKNKCFLGENGSNVLSFLLIFFLIKAHNKTLISMEYLSSFICLPFIDAIRLFIVRITQGRSPFSADKNHIHHILLKYYGFKKTIFIIIILIINPHIFYTLKFNMFYILLLNIFAYFFIIFSCTRTGRKI